jgi:hypothetical protein
LIFRSEYVHSLTIKFSDFKFRILALMMEAVCPYETFISTYKLTRSYSPKYQQRQTDIGCLQTVFPSLINVNTAFRPVVPKVTVI